MKRENAEYCLEDLEPGFRGREVYERIEGMLDIAIDDLCGYSKENMPSRVREYLLGLVFSEFKKRFPESLRGTTRDMALKALEEEA